MSARITVIVPCYNLGRYVEEAIDSVLAQTRQDFEIIVVNDGSTDPYTNEVLCNLRRPKTTVVATANQGLPAARNHGLRQAEGEFVCFLDADDRLRPRFLERTVAPLEADPSITFASAWLQAFGAEAWTWRRDDCGFPTLLAECVVLTAAPVRRDALEGVGGYDCSAEIFGNEDWDLWISLTERGHRGIVIPETLFDYRQRPGSMRHQAEEPSARLRSWHYLLAKHCDSYQRYAKEVLLLLEDQCGGVLLDNWEAQRQIETEVKPLLAARQRAHANLGATTVAVGKPLSGTAEVAQASASQRADHEALAAELDRASAEIRALRSSASWRVTLPLRRAWDLWLALRPPDRKVQ
jgi:glycosyltransferase involved in cell wall biosynthesis